MRRLIWGFAGRTYYIVGNLMHWLILLLYTDIWSLCRHMVCNIQGQNYNAFLKLMKTEVKYWFLGCEKYRFELIKIKIVSYFSIDYNAFFDHKSCIDSVNLLNINETCWNINT